MSSHTQLPELPALDTGIHLLDADSHARIALHALVLDHALGSQGDIYWLDAGRDASTTPLAQLAPSSRVLDRIQVARAFTPFQHHALVQTATETIPSDAALIVAPSFDVYYRGSDLGDTDGDALQARSLAKLAGITRKHDTPILVTRRQADDFSDPIAHAAEEVIEVAYTKLGPRFESSDFETLVYPEPGGFQTTITYWQRILAARHPEQVDAATPEGPEVPVDGAY